MNRSCREKLKSFLCWIVADPKAAYNGFRMSYPFPLYATASDSHVLGYVRADDVLSCGRRGALLLCLLWAYIWLVGSQSILWRCHCDLFLRCVKVLSEYFMATLIVAGFSSCCSCEFWLVEQAWIEIRLFRQSVGNRPEWNRTMSNLLCEKNLQQHRTIHGCWFGSFFIFPYFENNHPNWLIFFGGLKPPTRYMGSWKSPGGCPMCKWLSNSLLFVSLVFNGKNISVNIAKNNSKKIPL